MAGAAVDDEVGGGVELVHSGLELAEGDVVLVGEGELGDLEGLSDVHEDGTLVEGGLEVLDVDLGEGGLGGHSAVVRVVVELDRVGA